MSPANSKDFSPVNICFQEAAITYLFAAILEQRGVPTLILRDIKSYDGTSKLITEPQYLSNTNSSTPETTLIVGEFDDVKDLSSYTICRPLTEEKIEYTLRAFVNEA
ncbi:MAG: hypothetical protein KDD56_02595 [Bdellovibrionales bacterium]|nr:hypothetical protein [Bdellovibrionales bacterium]